MIHRRPKTNAPWLRILVWGSGDLHAQSYRNSWARVGCREGVTEIFNQGGRKTYLRLYHLSIRGVLSVGTSGLSCETSDVLSSLGVTAKGTLLLELCMKYAPASEYSRGRDRDCHSLVESWVDLEPVERRQTGVKTRNFKNSHVYGRPSR